VNHPSADSLDALARVHDKSRRRSSTAQKLARFQLTADVIVESIPTPASL